MDIRVKLNEKIRNVPKYASPSGLYTTFRDEFNYFTDHSDSYSYVRRPNMELKLKEYIVDSNNSFVFLTGLTGAGKSTLIKYIMNEQAAPNIFKIYISLNNGDIPDRSTFIRRFTANIIDGISNYAKTLNHETQEKIFSITDFKNYILNHPRYVSLAVEDFFPENKNLDEAINNILTYKTKKISDFPILSILWLQYLLFCNDNKTKCVLVIDDVEGVSENLQPEIFNYFLTVYTGLTTEIKPRMLEQGKTSFFSVTAFFAVRPDTLSFWKNRNGVALQANITINNEIVLRSPPSLKDIFLERFHTIQKNLSKEDCSKQQNREKLEKYQKVYQEILLPLLDRIDSVLTRKNNPIYSQVIMELANHNIREALDYLRIILVNGDFFHRPDIKDGAYGEIHIRQFYPSNIGILFSLAIQRGRIYHGFEPIVNVFRNNEDPQTDLIANLLIRYIYSNIKGYPYFKPLSWIEIKKEIMDIFTKIYPVVLFENAFKTIMKENIIIKTHDGNTTDNTDWFIFAPRGVVLLELLSSSSILLQCYREDLYRSTDEMNFIQEFTNSSQIKRKDVYLDMISYIRYYMDSELTLLDLLDNNGEKSKYINHYGTNLLAEQLCCVVKNDFQAYASQSTSINLDDVKEVNDNILLLEEDLNEYKEHLIP